MDAIKITADFARSLLKPIADDSHKGTFGHALLVGGSYGKMGAVCLASEAALRSGCGLATAYIPRCGYEIIQTVVPEVMAICDADYEFISRIESGISPQAIGIGPGMGQEPQTRKALFEYLSVVKSPIVIDADALNLLSSETNWPTMLPPRSVLTPHKKELERLIGTWQSDSERIQKVSKIAVEKKAVFVLKGAPTRIVDENSIYVNPTGNPALATGGTGDVLTGILTGFLAQRYEPVNAAILAVYLHGRAADLAIPEMGMRSFLARDILRYLPKAFLEIESGF